MGQIVAITGGAGSLAVEVARSFSRQGAQVALLDRSPPGSRAAGGYEPDLALHGVELTDLAATTAAFEAIGRHFGGLDVLVNVAGAFRWEVFETGSLDTWDHLYAANLRTAATACKAALPLLLARGKGRIVCIGAQAGTRATAGNGAYAASKAGVARLVEALADELRDRRITANAVLPGIIDTPRNRADMPQADFSRWVPPAAVASLVLYLASEAAACITGASIPITNGL